MASVAAVLGDPASVGVWNVVPEQSTIRMKAKTMWGLASVKGRFTEFSGSGQIDDAQSISGHLDIKADSLRTGIGRRDAHLHSDDFFGAEHYHDITVVVTGAEATRDDTVDLRAELSIKNTTRPVRLPTTVTVLDDGAVRLTTQLRINRQDFGVDGNLLGMVGDDATVSGDVVFRRIG